MVDSTVAAAAAIGNGIAALEREVIGGVKDT
jgi:hypothetical protein